MSPITPPLGSWETAIKARYPLIGRVIDLVQLRGISIFLVGGTVRDLLLGRTTRDLDFAVNADGLAVARYVADALGGAFVALDRQRRTGRVVLAPSRDPSPAQSWRQVYLDIAALRGQDLLADLQDRDFTMNAIALSRTSEGRWKLHDPLGGIADLQGRILRAVSPSSFVDDPVRTLRAVRMQQQFSCTIEPDTRISLRSAAPMLTRVSAERVRDEWFRILMQPKAAHALVEMHSLGLLGFVSPPVIELEDVTPSGVAQCSALRHSFAVVEGVERLMGELDKDRTGHPSVLSGWLTALAPQLLSWYKSRICDERTRLGLLKCAALLHNVGKTPLIEDFIEGSRGLMTLEQLGAEIAYEMGKRWRCSNAECDMLHAVVRWQGRPLQLSQVGPIRRRAIHRYFRDTGEYGVDAAVLSLSHQLAILTSGCSPKDGGRLPETVSQLLTAYFLQRQAVVDPTPFLSGHDLMGAFGLKPGPTIGWLLARLKEEQAAGRIRSRREALSRVQSWLDERKT